MPRVSRRLTRRRMVVIVSFAVWLGAAALACGPWSWGVIKPEAKSAVPAVGGDAQLASETVPSVSR